MVGGATAPSGRNPRDEGLPHPSVCRRHVVASGTVVRGSDRSGGTEGGPGTRVLARPAATDGHAFLPERGRAPDATGGGIRAALGASRAGRGRRPHSTSCPVRCPGGARRDPLVAQASTRVAAPGPPDAAITRRADIPYPGGVRAPRAP